MGGGSNPVQGSADLMIASPNEIKSGAPLLAVSVNISDEFSCQPGKNQAEHGLDRNAVLRAAKFGKQNSENRCPHPNRGQQPDRPKQINFQALDQLEA